MGLKGVDLIPQERRKLTFDPMIIFLIIIILLSAGAFWIYGKTYDNKIAARNDQIKNIKTQVQEIQEKIPDVDKIKKDIVDLKTQIAMIETLTKDPLKYSILLTKLKEVMPSNVWVKNLSIEPGSSMVTMSGEVLASPAVPPLLTLGYFIKTLQDSPFFGSVNLRQTSQAATEGRTTYSFQLESQFNPQKAAEVAKGGDGQ